MAWHTLKDALKLTGKSRSQLYRDMRSGLVSYRTGTGERREFETSELIRAYGELIQSETPKRHGLGHAEDDNNSVEDTRLDAIQQQLVELQQTVSLMIEDKTAREAERQQHEADRQRMQDEIACLNDALEREKKKGFWSRLFRD